MNSVEKEAVLHCLKAMIEEEVCEECPLYGITGTDHCEKDCVRFAINALEQEPCGDAISRQAAINAAIDGADKWDGGFNCEREKRIREEIEKLPPVTPQQKMGRWILQGNPYSKLYGWYKCSGCGAYIGEIVNYCSECGSYNGGAE